MSEMGDGRKEDIDEFFSEADEDELRLLVSLTDKQGTFTSDDVQNADEQFRPKLWGLAIENGIIEKQGNAYDLTIRSEISQYLSGDWTITKTASDEESDDEKEESQELDKSELPELDHSKANWSRTDKLVALGGFTGILGFSYGPIRNIIYGVLDLIFGQLLTVLPFFVVVLIITIFTSFWSTLVRERIIDADVSEFRDYIGELRGDGGGMFGTPDDATEEEEEMIMEAQQSMMKAQMKPFGWTMIVTIPMVIWVFTTANYGSVGTIILPILGEQVWAGTVAGPIQTWIAWYAPCSIVLSQVIKRLFDFTKDDEE